MLACRLYTEKLVVMFGMRPDVRHSPSRVPFVQT
jgi:hypothetical protein